MQDTETDRGDSPCEEEELVQPVLLPFHIVSTSATDIRFTYSICLKEHDRRPISYNSVICKQGMHQRLPNTLQFLRHVERLNMIVQIPDLGALIIANQAGRAMILTMTKSVHRKDHYGFRVDWILPFRGQEEQGLRPEVQLVGMAVSPIQGREGLDSYSRFDPPDPYAEQLRKPVEHPRRYRLFLFYSDHTVLSYEMKRTLPTKDPGVQNRVFLL